MAGKIAVAAGTSISILCFGSVKDGAGGKAWWQETMAAFRKIVETGYARGGVR